MRAAGSSAQPLPQAANHESLIDAATPILRNPALRPQNHPTNRNPEPDMPLYLLLTKIPRALYIVTAFTLYVLLLWMGGNQATVDHLPGRADFSKVYHLAFYSGWCCLVWLSMRQPNVAAAVALTTLAGAGDELHQYLLPFRDARVSDVLIDGCAALAGAFWMHALRRWAMVTQEARVRSAPPAPPLS
jgi:VanZ family protein